MRVEPLDELDTHLAATGETVRGPLSFSEPETKISVGRPAIFAIRPEDSANLLPPGSAADRSQFAVLRLAISIRPASEEWLERVWVSVSLDSDGDSAPTLWSLVPDRVSSTVRVENTLSVGANVKFLEAKAERKRSRDERSASVATFGLMESNGGWELSRVDGESLRGSYEFAAMIRADETAEIGGVAQYDATVGRRRFGVISAKCEVSGNGGSRFSLEAPSAGPPLLN